MCWRYQSMTRAHMGVAATSQLEDGASQQDKGAARSLDGAQPRAGRPANVEGAVRQWAMPLPRPWRRARWDILDVAVRR